MSFSDFSKVETLKSLNEFLADKSYVDGYVFINRILDKSGIWWLKDRRSWRLIEHRKHGRFFFYFS